jgi:[ribosomal protein S18]-alanine N-acetyltransferase
MSSIFIFVVTMISPSEPQPKTQPVSGISPDRLSVRRMKPQDVSAVMEIETVSFGRHHWSDESFYNEINNQLGLYYVLFDKHPPADLTSPDNPDLLISYSGLWQVLDEGHITTIAVRPDYRGNHLGEVMLLHLLEQCYRLSIKWVTLEVRVSNYGAQNLYYKYGFRSMGTRPRYYQDNQEDALIMTTPDLQSAEYRALYAERKDAYANKKGGFPRGFAQS